MMLFTLIFIADYFRQNSNAKAIWLDLLNIDGSYVWRDGSKATYQNWAANEPYDQVFQVNEIQRPVF